MNKILQADMQLIARPNDCWSSHILSAMEVLAHSHVFKHNLLNCKPVDLSRFVVDLTIRYVHNWGPYLQHFPERAQ